MQQPTPTKKPIKFIEFKVPTPKGDMVTTPFIFNKWVPTPDSTWVTPATIFYTRVLGGAIVSEAKFMDNLQEMR